MVCDHVFYHTGSGFLSRLGAEYDLKKNNRKSQNGEDPVGVESGLDSFIILSAGCGII